MQTFHRISGLPPAQHARTMHAHFGAGHWTEGQEGWDDAKQQNLAAMRRALEELEQGEKGGAGHGPADIKQKPAGEGKFKGQADKK